MKVLTSFLLLIVSLLSAMSQPIAGERFFYYENDLPEKLLTSKVMVLVSLPTSTAKQEIYKDWENYARRIHYYFRKIGIESTGYYQWEDVFASQDASDTYFNHIKDRGVDFICTFHYSHDEADSLRSINTLNITRFNKKATFFDHNQQAFQLSNYDFVRLMISLAKAVKSSGQSPGNFLIEDQPEIKEGMPLAVGKKSYTYNKDLKVSKLAVPMFKPLLIPKEIPPGERNADLLRRLEAYNLEIERANLQLTSVMEGYPFPYEIIAEEDDERTLFNGGFQFMLLNLKGGETALKRMLEMSDMDDADGMVSESSVKFYVKQLFSKDIYIGDGWDAGSSWKDGLEQYLRYQNSLE